MGKKNEDAPLRPGDYQIDEKDPIFDTGNFMINGGIKGLIQWFNKLDFNGDHIRDVAQLAPIVIRLIPVFVAAAPLIKEFLPMLNVAGIKNWFLSHSKDFFTVEKAVVETHLVKLEPTLVAIQAAGQEVAKLTPVA